MAPNLFLTPTLLLNSSQWWLKHLTKYSHMSHVSREIHTRRCYCVVFTTFRRHCHCPRNNAAVSGFTLCSAHASTGSSNCFRFPSRCVIILADNCVIHNAAGRPAVAVASPLLYTALIGTGSPDANTYNFSPFYCGGTGWSYNCRVSIVNKRVYDRPTPSSLSQSAVSPPRRWPRN